MRQWRGHSHANAAHSRELGLGSVRASLTVLLMRDLGPTSAGRKPFLASSGHAEQAADGSGGGPKLPSAATFGSFGIPSSKLP
ncbi:hypothetical protein PGT21_014302 [Puccinia graminis f. sp. tritici]|uniref:Uncharacterized protein n=1 Tax=Puccinia graminis f. sp. tritici TaxID=56615 RepID=A0A5B0QMZ7_PUCGR|nr:hypothetical protein PGT21_014302 [Puccinia graminis f. sp. tritici]